MALPVTGNTLRVGLRLEEPSDKYSVGHPDIETIADLILDTLGKPRTLKTTVPDRPSHDRRYLLDASKIRNGLGWAPTIALAEGLRETVAWYRDHPEWWEPLLERAFVVEDAWSRSGAYARQD